MRFVVILSIAGMLGIPAFSYGQDSTKADNTKVNQGDRNKAEPTADQQKENKSDRDLTKEIRRAITKDKSLSTYAHNVKVISENGSVTLRGPVRSEEEKKAIEAKAAEVAGKNVNSEISVVPDSKTQSQK
jgi:hyperosmotically inducible protein